MIKFILHLQQLLILKKNEKFIFFFNSSWTFGSYIV